LTGRVKGYRGKVVAILGEIPKGVKDSFPGEIKKAKDWCMKKAASHSAGMNSTQLKGIVGQLQVISDKGKEVIPLLIEVKDVRREAKAKELSVTQETLKAELAGTKSLLDKWEPGEHENIMNALDGISPAIDRGDFIKAEKGLRKMEMKLARLKGESTSLEAQDNQRHYVLNALRDVCKEMGWEEEKEPELEKSGNPRSALLYELDTYYAGKVTFRLTLENIRVDSQISKERDACYKEFDNLSERLKKFGVNTKFRPPEAPDEDPKLVQRGELDLPDEGEEMKMEA